METHKLTEKSVWWERATRGREVSECGWGREKGKQSKIQKGSQREKHLWGGQAERLSLKCVQHQNGCAEGGAWRNLGHKKREWKRRKEGKQAVEHKGTIEMQEMIWEEVQVQVKKQSASRLIFLLFPSLCLLSLPPPALLLSHVSEPPPSHPTTLPPSNLYLHPPTFSTLSLPFCAGGWSAEQIMA